MKNPCVVAVVVVYFPDETALARLLHRLALQVQHAVIVDNTDGTPSTSLQSTASTSQTWLVLGRNTGIAHAQNLGVELARERGATHILFMDQDSLPPADMVPRLLHTLASAAPDRHVAAVGPLCRDVKTGRIIPLIQRRGWRIQRTVPEGPEPIGVEYIPASGTLAPIAALERVGPLRAEYFIDRVDVEWCLRARHLGMDILVEPQCVMQHDQATRTVRLLGRTLYIGRDFRAYFHVRNSVAMATKAAISPFWRWDQGIKIVPYILLHILTAQHGRTRMAGVLLTALRDGLLGRMDRGHYAQRLLR